MIISEEIQIASVHNDRLFAVDITVLDDEEEHPVVMFIHGFKGFKDWGPFNVMARALAEAGFACVKCNMSHNGTTLTQPDGITDFEAFAKNTLSICLDDVAIVIDHLLYAEKTAAVRRCDATRLFLLGHSLGGSIAILKACEDSRVKAVAAWAPCTDFFTRWAVEDLYEWKDKGVTYVMNSREEQQLPLYYDIVEDYHKNKERLTVEYALEKMKAPLFLVHAKDDFSVPIGMSYDIVQWYEKAQLMVLEEGGHVFGGYHPYKDTSMPEIFKHVVEETTVFFASLL
jgi:uncharacterized protein